VAMKRFKLTVLIEDSLSASKKARGLEAKHGLSILVEVTRPKFSILMDAGPSSDTLLRNMEILGMRPEKIDAIFLSHGHYDHTGGLLGILKEMSKSVPIIAHPDIFNPKFKLTPSLRYIGPPSKPQELESFGGILLLAKNPIRIIKGVATTGHIERVTPYERPQGFWAVENDEFLEETMPDDQALILNLGDEGIVVISGCAHAGIINTIRHAQKLMGVKRIHAVVGGFHLVDSREERIKATIDDLAEIDPRFIYPCHCTGSKAIQRLTETFKKRCRRLGTGDTIRV